MGTSNKNMKNEEKIKEIYTPSSSRIKSTPSSSRIKSTPLSSTTKPKKKNNKKLIIKKSKSTPLPKKKTSQNQKKKKKSKGKKAEYYNAILDIFEELPEEKQREVEYAHCLICAWEHIKTLPWEKREKFHTLMFSKDVNKKNKNSGNSWKQIQLKFK